MPPTGVALENTIHTYKRRHVSRLLITALIVIARVCVCVYMYRY